MDAIQLNSSICNENSYSEYINSFLSHIDPDILATCSEIDKIEYAMCQSGDQIECPLTHVFTPGLYVRTAFMPAGSLIITVTHDTRHPFMITTGEADVISPEGTDTYLAPYMGITQPGTKRLIYVKKDVTWTTLHANPENLTDPDKIIEIITVGLNNPLLDPNDPKCKMWSVDVSPSITINAIDEIIQTENNQLNIKNKTKLWLEL